VVHAARALQAALAPQNPEPEEPEKQKQLALSSQLSKPASQVEPVQEDGGAVGVAVAVTVLVTVWKVGC
jgi:hypothetical protein